MVCTVLMCCVLSGAATGGDVASTASAPADLSVYDLAKSRAGKSGDAHVRLALWCEAHGMTAERLKHLGLAVLYDPANTVARGLLGLVPHEGKWGRPEAVGQKIQSDPTRQALIAEYLERRVRAAHKPDAQLKLAAWCDQNGLKAQALAHFNEVIRLDPTKDNAWRHLGFTKQGSRWVKPEEAAAERSRAERQKLADKQWKPKLEKLRDGLASKVKARRATAEQELAEVTDPRAVPMIWAVFVARDEQSQLAAVQLLGQIDSPAATSALAVLAVFNTRPNVRGRAASTLIRRDPRDYVGQLIGLIRKPFKYQVRPVNGPGSVGELFVEGERFNVRRLYEFQPINDSTMLRLLSQPSVPFDSFGAQYLMAALRRSGGALALIRSPQFAEVNALQAELSVGDQASGLYNRSFFNTQGLPSVAELQTSTLRQRIRESNDALQQRLLADVQVVETTNSQINQINDLALPVVRSATGQDLGVDPDAWKTWWTNQQGYAYQSSRPTIKPTFTDIFTAQAPDYTSNSCFAAGTIVQTVDGPRMIESIQVGDRVLSQNTQTGLLGFEPVVGVHQSKPATTLRIAAGDESIVATGIHRFWTAGKGWTMARDLKSGDRLRTIGGTATVRSIESGQTQPVFNLDVAENRNFFVGTNGLLVHDFSFVQPVLEPFDREPDLTTLSSKATSAAIR